MNRFIIKIFIFTVIMLGWVIIEGLLPPHTFTYRPWEALDFQTPFHLDRYFHPNTELEMESVGQLCHHTKYAIIKKEKWKTDELGNRNNSFIENPDVLIIGDSFVVGVANTQDSTVTNLLQSELGEDIKVYNIAPAEFSILDYYLKSNIITKPKKVIYLKSEFYVPNPLTEFNKSNSLKSNVKEKLKNHNLISRLSILLDKSIRQYSVNWIHARLTNTKGDGIPGIEGSNMFFYNLASHGHDPNLVQDAETDLLLTKNNIVSFKEYCDSLGIEFLFVPMPAKASVYYDIVPQIEQPDYIFKLDSMLQAENVQTINTLKLYNNYRKSNDNLLYHLDDNHWNANGTQIVSEEIAGIINSNRNYLTDN